MHTFDKAINNGETNTVLLWKLLHLLCCICSMPKRDFLTDLQYNNQSLMNTIYNLDLLPLS